jgi:hypothetical protein
MLWRRIYNNPENAVFEKYFKVPKPVSDQPVLIYQHPQLNVYYASHQAAYTYEIAKMQAPAIYFTNEGKNGQVLFKLHDNTTETIPCSRLPFAGNLPDSNEKMAELFAEYLSKLEHNQHIDLTIPSARDDGIWPDENIDEWCTLRDHSELTAAITAIEDDYFRHQELNLDVVKSAIDTFDKSILSMIYTLASCLKFDAAWIKREYEDEPVPYRPRTDYFKFFMIALQVKKRLEALLANPQSVKAYFVKRAAYPADDAGYVPSNMKFINRQALNIALREGHISRDDTIKYFYDRLAKMKKQRDEMGEDKYFYFMCGVPEPKEKEEARETPGMKL